VGPSACADSTVIVLEHAATLASILYRAFDPLQQCVGCIWLTPAHAGRSSLALIRLPWLMLLLEVAPGGFADLATSLGRVELWEARCAYSAAVERR
jgi:hypothetical protein